MDEKKRINLYIKLEDVEFFTKELQSLEQTLQFEFLEDVESYLKDEGVVLRVSAEEDEALKKAKEVFDKKYYE